jgi:trans-2-enoyl-CoA reductase
MKTIAYCVLGLVLASLLAWAGLLGWAATNLNPNDSLWDRNPQAANGFAVVWLLLSVVGGAVGVWLARRKK